MNNGNHHDSERRTFFSFFPHVRCGLLTVVACGWALATAAQTSLPDSFNPNANGIVYALAVQADSKILTGGNFSALGGVSRNNVARLNLDGTLDTAFNPNANGSIRALAVQADGKIVVGGNFTTMGGVIRNYIARLNADGTLDTVFNPNANSQVCSLAVLADGKILAGGSFTTMGGVTRNRIARLNADGTLDTAFSPNSNNEVYSLALQADDKILIGGYFTTMGGVTRNRIARLNADGTLDATFNPDADSTVYSLVVQNDGKILVGGSFWMMGGVIHNGIARLNADGTLDTAFYPNASSSVLSMAVQSDGKILVGGYFTSMGGVSCNYIAQLNADGTLVTAFNPSVNDTVFSLAVQADGKILVGGQFTSMGGFARNYISRLTNLEPSTDNLDYRGTRISWLRGGTGPEVWRTTFEYSTNGVTYSMLGVGSRLAGGWELTTVSVPSGTIRARGYTAGGQYNGSGGIVESGFGKPAFAAQPNSRTNSAGTTASFTAIAIGSSPLAYRWRKDEVYLSDGGNVLGATTATLCVNEVIHGDMGEYDVVVNNGYGSVTSVVATLSVVDPAINVQPSSRIGHVGGDTTFSVTASGTGLLTYQWLKNGLLLNGATNTMLSMTNLQVSAVGNYSVVVCGAYGCVTSAVVELSVNLASMDTDFNPNAGSSVSGLALQADGKILVGGGFTTMGGVTRNSIARLNVDGTLDTAFISGPSEYGVVKVLSVQPDGKILVGGWFGSMSGQPRNSIARLNADGTLDATFNPNASYWVLSMAVQADGKILVGGLFTTIGGVTRNYIARLNTDGTLETAFNPNANSFVNALALQADGKILVGGQFTAIGGVPRNCIARLNADGTLDTAFNPNAGSYVYSLAVQADGKILVGGIFTTMGGVMRNRIARLNMDGTLDTGFDPNANLSVSSLAVQADGKILLGGSFTAIGGVTRNYVAQLNADGTPEATFNPDANNQVNALAVQADGKVLAGGLFTAMDGLSRNCIARLNSTGPVVDKINYDGATVTWSRGGTVPEVWRTTFECVTNGTSWKMLGAGTRISGGWKLEGVSSTGKVMRARGYTANGIVESLPGGLIFIKEPTNATCKAGETNTFIVTVSGSAPIYYRWRKGGADLGDIGKVSGASTPSLKLSGVFKSDEGQYDVVISNPSGCVTSGVATLTVVDPAISVQPVSQVRTEGSNVTFSVTTVGTGVLNYQWRKNGISLLNATNASLTFSDPLAADAGSYDVVASGACGSVTSAVAVLTINPGMVDRLFYPNANSSVYTLAVQPDGRILIGGSFTTIGGVTRNRIARLNADGTLDTVFNPNASSTVYSLALQADGKILIAGDFTTMGGVTRNRIARLNADGTLDATFNPNANMQVYSLALQVDGKILVGGFFTTMGGVTRNWVARLNADGTLDTAFNPNASSTVYALAVQADGKILIGGGFWTMVGVTRNNIARLNVDGTLDNAFNPNANNQVNTLVVQADSKILVGGSFSMMGGVTRNRIARLNADGMLDAAFNPNAGSTVYSLAVQADGKILVCGTFTTIGGVTRNRIARLNADGTLDAGFNPNANNTVNALAIQADGKILVGGPFTKTDGLSRNYIARLNSTGLPVDTLGVEGGTVTWLRGGTAPEVLRTTFECVTNGTLWTMLGTGARISSGWQLAGVSVTGGTIRARGYTTGGQYNGSCGIVESSWGRPVITEQPVNVTCQAGMTASFGITVVGSAPFSYSWRKAGQALAEGERVGGATAASLNVSSVLKGDEGAYDVVIVNPYGSVTSGVATLTVADPAINVQPVSQVGHAGGSGTLSVTIAGTGLTYQWWKDGLLLTGATNTSLNLTNLQGADAGNYSMVACGAYGCVTSAVVELSVNLAAGDPSFNPNTDHVCSLVAEADGKVLVGGKFTAMGGVTRNNIARLNANGTLDTTFNPNANNWIYSLAVQSDCKILVGGYFTKMGVMTRNYIARLNEDGTLDTAFNPNANTFVYSLAVQADGKILVGGAFSSMAGVTRYYIARLNANGTLDTTFNPNANNVVNSLAVQGDTKILIGGTFTTIGGGSRNRIARLNADGTLDATFNPNAGGSVSSLAVQTDGKILVGGGFTTMGGVTRNCIARLNADGTLDTEFNPSPNNDSVSSLMLQADGKILVGGTFTTMCGMPRNFIARLNANGTIDATFNPNANAKVSSLAVQADGKVLVGGQFTTMDGLSRNGIARLNSSGPVVDKIAYDGETVTWLRGGTVPEVWRTTFEYSTNGTSWTMMGAGTCIPGGWQLAGISPTCSVIRARGYTAGGEFNGSGGIMESVLVGPIITTTRISTATVGVNYSATLQASIGIPPYCWTVLQNNGLVTNGFLPAGLQLSTNGVITGIPSTPGVYWPTFVVTDSVGCIASNNIMLLVGVSLNILSDHGITQPSMVVTNYSAVVSESLTNSPVVNGATQYVCKGWSLAGVLATNGQSSGSSTTVAMTLTNNATLTWLWTTNYWFQREAGAAGVVGGNTNGWYARDSQVTVTAVPSSGCRLSCWTGDVPAGHTNDNPLVVSMDAARSVFAQFAVITLPEALNCTRQTWTTGGNSVWWGQAVTNHDTVSAAQSGLIIDRQSSWFQTTVYGAGDLSFWWKVSSEADYDFLRFKVDGATWREISGETGWQFVSLRVGGSGLHTFEWSYAKDKDSLAGSDAGWVDQVSWTPSGFAFWMQSNGLSGDPTTVFASDRNSDNMANGFEYAFGTNWSFGQDILNIRLVNRETVVEFPVQDSSTIPYVSLTLKGCTNLLCLPGDWTLQTVPATNTTGKPANRNWLVPVGLPPTNAFFRINATLLP